VPVMRVERWEAAAFRQTDQARPDAIGEWGWYQLVPALHRALANPYEEIAFPRFRTNFGQKEACAYWEAAWYLLYRLVGWRDLGAGLRWWFETKKPIDDARLALLRELFDDQGQLELLAMWAWTSPDLAAGGRARRCEDFLGRAYFEEFKLRHPDADGPRWDPYASGGLGATNPLHLGKAIDATPGGDVLFLVSENTERRGVLVVERASEWHAALVGRGERLPDLGDRSWNVEVVARAIGSLGTFRRSRVTGEWFQGRHSVHVAGA
jgi:hypothetical protein